MQLAHSGKICSTTNRFKGEFFYWAAAAQYAAATQTIFSTTVGCKWRSGGPQHQSNDLICKQVQTHNLACCCKPYIDVLLMLSLSCTLYIFNYSRHVVDYITKILGQMLEAKLEPYFLTHVTTSNLCYKERIMTNHVTDCHGQQSYVLKLRSTAETSWWHD